MSHVHCGLCLGKGQWGQWVGCCAALRPLLVTYLPPSQLPTALNGRVLVVLLP